MKNTPDIRILYISVFLCLYTQASIAESLTASIGERRHAAVQQAREGKFDLSLPELAKLVAETPEDIGIVADYIVALTWANKNQEALDVAKSIQLKTAPIYCVSALAKAARDVGDFQQALTLYEQLINRQAGNLDPVFGRLLTLIDLKEFDKAEAQLSVLRNNYPNKPEVYRAMSYLGQVSQQPIVVIDANTRLLAINPQDNDAARLLIKASNEAGASHQAILLAKKYPNAIDQNGLNAISNDHAAHHLAWGHYAQETPAERFADIDIALAKLDEVCRCNWAQLDLSSSQNKNLLFDRIVALRDRYRMPEVIAHHPQLSQAKIDLPDYVLNALGDAYLYQRMPEQALKLYDESLRKKPQNVQVSFAKFYALIELEQFEAAYQLIDTIAQNQAVYRNRPKNPIVREGEYKLDADMKAAYARAYGDDLAFGEQQFQKLLAIGPMNKELQMALAEIWRWRGWPELAEKKFAELVKAQPNQVQAKVNLAHTHLDLRDWKVAENEITPLFKDYPENSAVKELERRWELHNKRELVVEAGTTDASGGTFGTRENTLNAQLYSRPFNDHYRAFIATRYDRSAFLEGAGTALFAGGGLEYTDRDWRLTGAIGDAGADASGMTIAMTADYRLDDYWSFGTGLELNSYQMPLRGLKEGTNGDLLYANARYRWSDLASAELGANYMAMDDGNHRQAVNLAFSNRIITQPHYKLSLNTRLDASKNDQRNVLYFNPERDLDVGLVADNVWTQWRSYDRSFSHRVQVGVGQYWQKNYGSNSTWMMSYEQQWKWDNALEFSYGVSRNQHPYDGVDEYFTQYFCRLNWLF
jgi:biofilm PGA synthesis protein PgaA